MSSVGRTVAPDPFTELRSPQGSLVSLYASRPSPGGFAALLSDLLRPIREQAATRDRTVEMSVRADVERIRDLAESFETGSAPAYAVFASDADGIFQVEALTHEVPDVALLGHRPYLRPLRTRPRDLRAGFLVADRLQARVFVVCGSVVTELGDPIEAEPVKRDYGGFEGNAEHTARQRADENAARLWKDAGQRLFEAHQERPLDFVAIGAPAELADGIARALHPYLAQLPRVDFPAVPGSVTETALRSEAASSADEVRRNRQAALAGRVCDTAWSGGMAVLGLSRCLAASNAQAIETLVIAGDLVRPGVLCGSCGFLARSGEECPVCGDGLIETEDVVADLIEAVVAAGGSVHQIEVASPLDNEGVGALTRFPVTV
jgi:peptide chain release factor subunit 1